jgi:hypothetical protein
LELELVELSLIGPLGARLVPCRLLGPADSYRTSRLGAKLIPNSATSSTRYRGVFQKCFPDANFHRFVLAGVLPVKLPGKICTGRHAGAYKFW